MRTIVFDDEPVQALLHAAHPQHRTVMAHLAGIVVRRRRGVIAVAVVPAAVRVEAGWDRRDPRAATANRLRIADVALDAGAANLAADVVARTHVSVADAHVGVTALAADGDVVVLASDPDDIRRAVDPRRVTVVVV